VDPSGIITTIAGTGTAGWSGDGGPAAAARINAPTGLSRDAAGNLYLADTLNHRVRRIDGAGSISTVAGNGSSGSSGDSGLATAARLNAPEGVASRGGSLYIADTGNHKIRKVDGAGIITTFVHRRRR
jgi:hypothetical protein